MGVEFSTLHLVLTESAQWLEKRYIYKNFSELKYAESTVDFLMKGFLFSDFFYFGMLFVSRDIIVPCK